MNKKRLGNAFRMEWVFNRIEFGFLGMGFGLFVSVIKIQVENAI